MTIYHVHHIVPKHAGGTDDPSNLVKLTIEEHAEAHRKLYEEYGRMQDWYAWQGLIGCIDKADIIKRLQSEGSKERNARHIKNGTHNFLGEMNPSHKRVEEGTHHFQHNIGNRPSDIVQRELVSNGKHYFQSQAHKDEVSNRSKEQIKKTTTCPHCGKTGQKVAMGRWHFDNCSNRVSS